MAARGAVAGAGQAHVAEPMGTEQPDGGVGAVPEDGTAIAGNDLRKLVVSIELMGGQGDGQQRRETRVTGEDTGEGGEAADRRVPT